MSPGAYSLLLAVYLFGAVVSLVLVLLWPRCRGRSVLVAAFVCGGLGLLLSSVSLLSFYLDLSISEQLREAIRYGSFGVGLMKTALFLGFVLVMRSELAEVRWELEHLRGRMGAGGASLPDSASMTELSVENGDSR